MKFTLALFAAASAELQSKPDTPNSFEDQRDTLREHITLTLDQWYSGCPSYEKWSNKLGDMVDRLDRAYNKCGTPYEEWTRKRRQTTDEDGEEFDPRLSKNDKAKATNQIRTVVKRLNTRNLVNCTRNRMYARAERIVAQMVEEDGNGSCGSSE